MALSPPFPSGFNYSLTSVNQVNFTWFAVSGAVSYNIYNRNGALSNLGNPINPSPITTVNYTDTSFNGLQENYYSITYVNSLGVESLPSATIYIPISVGSSYVMPRVDFWPSAFDKFILEHGYEVIWEKAISCPCNKSTQSTTDAGDLDCRLCNGKHFIWVNPTKILCAMQSMTRDFDLKEDGIYQIGDYKVTTHSSNKIGFYDRLTFLETSAPLTETVEKGAADGTDSFRFPASNILLPIIDRAGNYYNMTTDFTLDASGKVVWDGPSHRQPPTGMFYGVNYMTQWRMLSTEYSHDIRATHVQLGTTSPIFVELARQAICKLEWFFNI